MWSIFSNFLNKIWSFKEKYYSPLGEETNLVIESGVSSFSVQCLIVSVCIEALLKKFYKNQKINNDNFVPRNYLKDLVRRGIINQNQYKSWKSLRNKETHGDRKSSKIFQEQLWRYDDVLELFYRLILNYLDYTGLITSIGRSGTKDVQFKPIN